MVATQRMPNQVRPGRVSRLEHIPEHRTLINISESLTMMPSRPKVHLLSRLARCRDAKNMGMVCRGAGFRCLRPTRPIGGGAGKPRGTSDVARDVASEVGRADVSGLCCSLAANR